MMASPKLALAGIALAMTLVSSLGAGCGETGDTDPTPVQTFKITPASNATSAPSPAGTQLAPADTPVPAETPSAGDAIVVAGVSNTFDIEEIEAPAGSITVEFDNRDGGVVHNIHFFRGDDADGESVAETEIEVGPIKQTVTFDVQAGTYFYQCDAHPTTMTGTLTVE